MAEVKMQIEGRLNPMTALQKGSYSAHNFRWDFR